MLLSVPIIIRNCVKLQYPLDRVVKSVVGLADEVVIAVDPQSVDDSLDYVYDLALEVNSGMGTHGTSVRWFESKWDLSNVDSSGSEFARQTNIVIDACLGSWVLSLQGDESVFEGDFDAILNFISRAEKNSITAGEMIRLYFYGDINTIREDWTVPITRLFKKGSRYSCGDAMNTDGFGRVERLDGVYIYHYSRIGDPEILSKRILSLDKFFHPAEKLLTEEEVKPYDFSTYNFDCQHREGVDVGREQVEGRLVPYTGKHPCPFVGYIGV